MFYLDVSGGDRPEVSSCQYWHYPKALFSFFHDQYVWKLLQHSRTNGCRCPSKTQHSTKLPDTVLNQNSLTVAADIAFSNNIVNLDELTAGTGYVDPVLSNTFNLSLLVRGSKISSAFHLNKSKEELHPTLGMETDPGCSKWCHRTGF